MERFAKLSILGVYKDPSYISANASLHKKIKFSIQDFFSKCGHIYWRNPELKTSFYMLSIELTFLKPFDQ